MKMFFLVEFFRIEPYFGLIELLVCVFQGFQPAVILCNGVLAQAEAVVQGSLIWRDEASLYSQSRQLPGQDWTRVYQVL